MTVLKPRRSASSPDQQRRWTAARIVSAVGGVLLGVCSLGPRKQVICEC